MHNAFAAYEAMLKWQSSNGGDLLSAHQILMQGLELDAGQWRVRVLVFITVSN